MTLLIVAVVFVLGFAVIDRLEKWADTVGLVLGLTVVGLLSAFLLTLAARPTQAPREARAGQQARIGHSVPKPAKSDPDVTGSIRR
ncbi:hypothetical protein [Methylobacterium nodulans]|uniref:hypothetical protein n=1 Tax=Methylobacterium nodulans TaxID=114616 RepID=UPI0012EE6A0A|nr:hypothetical protein [Methylobacterium nodulans]